MNITFLQIPLQCQPEWFDKILHSNL
uniref:Uncharacterized protein n=1 Tax=Triticum urartu TaxID=4572 RepID=A0A8R7PLH6_TRIUA